MNESIMFLPLLPLGTCIVLIVLLWGQLRRERESSAFWKKRAGEWEDVFGRIRAAFDSMSAVNAKNERTIQALLGQQVAAGSDDPGQQQHEQQGKSK